MSFFIGSQQQWFTRNSNLGKWDGGVWNMVFSGNTGGIPDDHCGNSDNQLPITSGHVWFTWSIRSLLFHPDNPDSPDNPDTSDSPDNPDNRNISCFADKPNDCMFVTCTASEDIGLFGD